MSRFVIPRSFKSVSFLTARNVKWLKHTKTQFLNRRISKFPACGGLPRHTIHLLILPWPATRLCLSVIDDVPCRYGAAGRAKRYVAISVGRRVCTLRKPCPPPAANVVRPHHTTDGDAFAPLRNRVRPIGSETISHRQRRVCASQ